MPLQSWLTKWEVAVLPRLELSLFFFPPAPCRHARLWRTGVEFSAATFGKHPAAGLMGKQASLHPPHNPGASGGAFDSFMAEGPGGRRPFVSQFIQSVWFPAPHSNQLASYLWIPACCPQAHVCFSCSTFSLSAPLGSESYKCLDRAELNWAVPFVPGGSLCCVCTCRRSQTCYPQGSFFKLSPCLSPVLSVLNAARGQSASAVTT